MKDMIYRNEDHERACKMLGAAMNIKRWITTNPLYDTPEARLQMADFVHMARLFNHKSIKKTTKNGSTLYWSETLKAWVTIPED